MIQCKYCGAKIKYDNLYCRKCYRDLSSMSLQKSEVEEINVRNLVQGCVVITAIGVGTFVALAVFI